jgi:hypothetical protein
MPSDRQVIAAWNASSSPGEAARSLDVPRLYLLERALVLRIEGHDLKPMDILEPHQRAALKLAWREPMTAPSLKRARVRMPVRGQDRNTRHRRR